MTTTSTFQGVDSDSKPSSRVLNPPGGGSSNIFGGYDNQTNARTPVRNNPDNVNRGNNDIFNRDSHAAASTPSLQNPSNVNRGSNDIFNQGCHAAAPQPSRSRAPRSGEDSFSTLFGCGNSPSGNSISSANKNNSSPVVINHGSTSPQNHHRRRKSPDTFATVYGEGEIDPRKINPKHGSRNDDSFFRVFNQSSQEQSKFVDIPDRDLISKSQSQSLASDKSSLASVHSSTVGSSLCSSFPSNSSTFTCTLSKENQDHEESINSSFSRVFGQYMAKGQASRHRRLGDRGEYNPITGELYEKPRARQEPPAPVQSENNSSTSDVVAETAYDNSAEAHASAPQPENRQQGGSGIFGGRTQDEPRGHPSTRVSQPPGGRSTKLW